MRIPVDEAYYGSQTLGLFRLSESAFEVRLLTTEVDPPVSRRLAHMELDQGVGSAVAAGELILAQRWFEQLLTFWTEAPWALTLATAIEPRALRLATSYTSLAYGELVPDLLQTRFFTHRHEPIIGWVAARPLSYLLNRTPRAFANLRKELLVPCRHLGKTHQYSFSHILAVYHVWSLLGGSPFRSAKVTTTQFGPPLDLRAAYDRCAVVNVLDGAVASDPDLGVRILQARLLSVLRHTSSYRELTGHLDVDDSPISENGL